MGEAERRGSTREAAQAEDGKQKPQPPAHLTEGGRKPQPPDETGLTDLWTEWGGGGARSDGERSPPPPDVRPHSGDKIASKRSGRSGGWRGTATWVFGFGSGLIRTRVGPGPN